MNNVRLFASECRKNCGFGFADRFKSHSHAKIRDIFKRAKALCPRTPRHLGEHGDMGTAVIWRKRLVKADTAVKPHAEQDNVYPTVFCDEFVIFVGFCEVRRMYMRDPELGEERGSEKM